MALHIRANLNAGGKRGAAGQQYAIIVGLIAVIAIASIATSGAQIKTLFGKVGNSLTSVTNGVSAAETTPPPAANYTSCKAALNAGQTVSGTYTIDPDGAGPTAAFTAYCDQTTAGGGWTYLVRAGAKTDPALTIGWTGHASGVCGTLSNNNLSWNRTLGSGCTPAYPGVGLKYTFPAATDFRVVATWTHSDIGAGYYAGPSVDGNLARSTTNNGYCNTSATTCGWANQTYSSYSGTYSISGSLLPFTLNWLRTGNTMSIPSGDATTTSFTISTNDKVLVSVGAGTGSAYASNPLNLVDVYYREQ